MGLRGSMSRSRSGNSSSGSGRSGSSGTTRRRNCPNSEATVVPKNVTGALGTLLPLRCGLAPS